MSTTYSIKPILGSTVLVSLQTDQAVCKKRDRVGTGSAVIDDALKGGVDVARGGVTCISGEKGTGRTGLAFALLTTYLLTSSAGQGVVVDTTGTFDVLRLYNTILSRLRLDYAAASLDNVRNRAGEAGSEDADLEDRAAKVLDRVKIMRVFDFAGVTEAIGEVLEKLKGQRQVEEQRQAVQQTEHAEMVTKRHSEHEPTTQRRKPIKRIRSTIADSEDEGEDEMLFDGLAEEEVQAEEMEVELHGQKNESSDEHVGEKEPESKVGMIVVDNITHVVSPMMKANYVQTSALLTTFLRSLTHLTQTHSLSTILINASSPSSANTAATANAHDRSIFPSTLSSPALAHVLPFHVDLHLFLTTQPLSRGDAAALQRRDRIPAPETVVVVEVLADRYGDRVGRWAPFRLNAERIVEGVGLDVRAGGREGKR